MDRKQYKSEKKLAEQGWRSMRRTLDREMPGERRRRPVALFWILGLLLPGSAGLAWLLFSPGNPDISTQPLNPPAAAVPHRKSGQTDLPSVAPLPQASALSAKPAAEQKPINAGAAQPKSAPVSAPVITAVRPGPVERAAELPTARQTEPAMQNTAAPKSVLKIEPVENQAVAPTDRPLAMQPSPTNTSPETGAMPNTPLAQPSPLLPTPLPPPVEPVKSSRLPKWSFGASAGILFNPSVRYTGLTAGVTAAWQPNRQWGIRSGLSYQYHILPATERPIVSISTATYAASTGNLKVYDNNGSFAPTQADATAPVYVPVARLHRVEMPLLGFYQPTPKLRLFGGVSVGANVYADSGNRSLKNNVVYDIQANSGSLNQEVSNKLRSWDTRWGAGFGFLPNRHLELDLFYFHGFISSGKKSAGNLLYSNGAQDSFGQNNNNQQGGTAGNSPLFQLAATCFFK